jgi:hypothetical protein
MLCYLRLFSPAIVLAVWAIVWALGGRGAMVVGAGLALTAVASAISEWQAHELRKEIRRDHPR